MAEQQQHAGQLEAESASDFDKLVASVKKHPLAYVAGVLLVVVGTVGYFLYSANNTMQNEHEATELIRATKVEDPADRMAKLDSVAEENGTLTPEALYLKGETAFAQGDYDAARAAYQRVVSDFPDFQFSPDALEGLGYIEEASENYDAAVANYLDVQVKYPKTYEARRQAYNLGRVYAAQGKYKDAIDSYRRQVGEFPDSRVADRARAELRKYQISHPDLFKEFEEQFSTTSDTDQSSDTNLVVVPPVEESGSAAAPEESGTEENAGQETPQ